MAIRPGTLTNFTGSMAAAIEDELDLLLRSDLLPGLLKDNSQESRDVRRLLVAIARGVVKHFEAQQTDIDISYLDGGTTRVSHPVLHTDMT